MIDDAVMTDDLVLVRTEDGEREALLGAIDLSSVERRLLLFVNSLTSLADLLPRFPDADGARQSARNLMDAGLVADAEEVKRARQTFPMES